MSKIKNMSRAGWIVTGVVAALVLVPTAAVAVTNAVTIKGSPSGNKADVSAAGQLLTTTANPSSFFQSSSQGISTTLTPVTSPPTGLALVVTTIHLDVYGDPSPGSGQAVAFFIVTGTTCSGSLVGSYGQIINPNSIGEIDVPFAPGLGLPAGDALCGQVLGSVAAEASVSGYTVPSSSVTSGPLHHLSPLPKQR